MYAIIATGGKQYKVSEGDVLKVEKLNAAEGDTVTFDQVIAVSDNGLKAGADVASATVSATVVGEGKRKKVIVYKYKRKSGYHKKNGHRQPYTQVKIEKIQRLIRNHDEDISQEDKHRCLYGFYLYRPQRFCSGRQ